MRWPCALISGIEQVVAFLLYAKICLAVIGVFLDWCEGGGCGWFCSGF